MPYPDDIDVDTVLQQLRRRAEDGNLIAHIFQKYDDSTLRDFIKSKSRGGTHRSAAAVSGMDVADGPLIGPEVDAIVLDRDHDR